MTTNTEKKVPMADKKMSSPISVIRCVTECVLAHFFSKIHPITEICKDIFLFDL